MTDMEQHDMDPINQTSPHSIPAVDSRPYAMIGAGKLTSAIWKSGDERSGWQYCFNLFRMDARNGQVSQLFSPEDIMDLARSVRLLAFTLSDDGCLEQELRDDLSCLWSCLDDILPPDPMIPRSGEPPGPR